MATPTTLRLTVPDNTVMGGDYVRRGETAGRPQWKHPKHEFYVQWHTALGWVLDVGDGFGVVATFGDGDLPSRGTTSMISYHSGQATLEYIKSPAEAEKAAAAQAAKVGTSPYPMDGKGGVHPQGKGGKGKSKGKEGKHDGESPGKSKGEGKGKDKGKEGNEAVLDGLQARILDAKLEDGRDRNPIACLFPPGLPVKPLDECLDQVKDDLPSNFMALTRKARRKAKEVKDMYPALTDDDRAICTLYTMEMSPREQSFYYVMNAVLRDMDRRRVQKWRDTIWLLVTSLRKLPQPDVMVLFRGARVSAQSVGKQAIKNEEFIWSAFSSTTTNIEGMKNFLGTEGPRVQWVLEMRQGYLGRDLRNFSFFPQENEILLPPNTEFEVVSVLDVGNGLTQVQCKQIEGSDPIGA